MATRIRGEGEARPHRARSVNIPIGDIYNATQWVGLAFDSKVVMLGGRAINFWCFKDARPTHDIDVIVERKPTTAELEQLKEIADYGASFVYNGNPESVRGRVKLFYHSPVVDRRTTGEGMQIDLYYPYYRSAVNNFMPRTDINGLPIQMLLDTSEEISMGNMSMYVVAKEPLTIMKFITWQERGEGLATAKDMRDIKNMFRNHFDNPHRLHDFIVRATEILDENMPHRREEILDGIITHVYSSFDEQMKAEAKKALRRAS